MLDILISEQPPYIIVDKKVPKMNQSVSEFQFVAHESVSGIFMEILLILSKDLNFNFTLKRRTDESWGRRFKNEQNQISWNGMIGSLLEKKADFIAASLTMRQVRQKVIDYLIPIGTETRALFIKRKHPEELAWRSYFYPFSYAIWPILFGLTLTALIVALLLSERLSISEAFLLWISICQSFLGKPLNIKSKRKAVLMFIFTVGFFGSIIFMVYRASLTSELSIRRSVQPFNNPDAFVESQYDSIYSKFDKSYFEYLKSKDGSGWSTRRLYP